MNAHFQSFVNLIRNPLRFRYFLLQKLPAAFFVGLRIVHLDAQKCIVKVQYNWFTKNPFKSMYFAVEAMAAELSTGLIVFGQTYQRQPKISMLVSKMEASFFKKAIGKIIFTCEDGLAIQNAIQKAITDKEGQTITCVSEGHNEAGELVARFQFTWTVKEKN